MATIKTIHKHHNDIIGRTEGTALIEFEGTLKIADAQALIAKKLACDDQTLVKIKKINIKYGTQNANVLFEQYDDHDIMTKLEVVPKKLRVKPKTDEKLAA